MPNRQQLPYLTAILLAVGGLVFAVSGLAVAEGASNSPAKTAFVGFRLESDSLEPVRDDERARLKKVSKQMRDTIEKSPNYSLVPVPEDVMQRIEAGQDFGGCGGCEVDYGKELGADLIGWGVVQKVSNLILNINVYIADVKTAKMVFVKSVDIRGNDDTSWRKGLGWLLKYYFDQDEKKKS